MKNPESRAFQGRFGRAVLFDTDTPVVAHAHSQCHMLIKCGGADGRYDVNGERAPFRDDTIVLVNPWIPHSNPRPAGGPGSRVLALYVEPVWLSERWTDIISGQTKLFLQPSAPISTLVRSLADHLAATMIAGASSEVRLEEILYDLIDRTLSTYADGKMRSDLPKSSAALDYRIRRAIAHMRDHVSKEDGDDGSGRYRRAVTISVFRIIPFLYRRFTSPLHGRALHRCGYPDTGRYDTAADGNRGLSRVFGSRSFFPVLSAAHQRDTPGLSTSGDDAAARPRHQRFRGGGIGQRLEFRWPCTQCPRALSRACAHAPFKMPAAFSKKCISSPEQTPYSGHSG